MLEKHDLKYIGKSLKRSDAKGKLTGATNYITDISLDGMLYAAPVYSSIPFGKIVSIDTSDSEKISGFVDFISAKDVPGENQVGVIYKDQPLFADKIVRYVGDSIGIAVAETYAAAHQSAKSIKIEYEKYSPIFTIDESRQSISNFIHKSNLVCHHRVRKGKIEEGFKLADQIIKAEFKTPCQEHYYLEPQGNIVAPTKNGIKVIGSFQCVFYIQKAVAHALGIELNDVIVEQTPTGGGFGGKEDIPSELGARVAVAVNKLKRPIKMIYNRLDDIQLTSKRHPFQMKYKVGVTNDGKLIAAEILMEEDSGAYGTLSSIVSYRANAQAMGPYVIPNIKVDSNAYYTNLPTNGAFRGFGSPQATFGHERMMDTIATQLGIDPLELRLNNILKVDTATLTDHKLTASVGASETINRAAEKANWTNFVKTNDDIFLHGMGISTIHYGNCLGAAGWKLDGSAARIQIHKDGKISVSFGLVEMGQGAIIAIEQMVADALGIAIDRITVLDTSTENVRDSGPSVASRNIVMTGNAIRNTAELLLPMLKTAAAEMLNGKAESICINNDLVTNLVSGEILSFGDFIDFIYSDKSSFSEPLIEKSGWWHVPKLDYNPDNGIGEAYFTYSYATHIAKVRVNKLTGQVHVDNIWAAHDVGKAINPAGVEAQIEGGATQGIGFALTENMIFKDGKIITDNLSTYLLPTASDISKVEAIIVEHPEPNGPWGAKGIGEPSLIPTAAAIANAVSNAIGKPVNEIPIKPQNILDLLN